MRVRLTLLYGLVSFVAVGVFAAIALHLGARRIDDDLERDAEQAAADVVVALAAGQGVDDGAAWLVSPDEAFAEPLGDPVTEPPLQPSPWTRATARRSTPSPKAARRGWRTRGPWATAGWS